MMAREHDGRVWKDQQVKTPSLPIAVLHGRGRATLVEFFFYKMSSSKRGTRFQAQRVEFNNEDVGGTAEEAARVLEEDGVVVVINAYTTDEAHGLRDEILEAFEKLGTGFDSSDPNTTWVSEVLPAQSRRGMFQNVMAGAPPVRRIRSDQRLVALWEGMHAALGHVDPVTDGPVELLTSNDGINVTPPKAKSEISRGGEPDWPHTDAITGTGANASIQGQVVLNGSQAVLRATPKSHAYWDWTCEEVMSDTDRDRGRMGWHKLNKAKQRAVREKMEADLGKRGLFWQVPIYAPAGSLVLWYSSTIHSSTGYAHCPPRADALSLSEIAPKSDPLHDWRCIVYLCHFPAHLHDSQDGGRERIIAQLEGARANNRCTSHSSLKVFPKIGRPYTRDRRGITYDPEVVAIMKDPQQALELWA